MRGRPHRRADRALLTSHTWAFSPDGRHIVSGSADNTVRLWDAATGQPVGDPLSGHTDAVLSVGFSPDGTRIASGGARPNGAAVRTQARPRRSGRR